MYSASEDMQATCHPRKQLVVNNHLQTSRRQPLGSENSCQMSRFELVNLDKQVDQMVSLVRIILFAVGLDLLLVY